MSEYPYDEYYDPDEDFHYEECSCCGGNYFECPCTPEQAQYCDEVKSMNDDDTKPDISLDEIPW